MNDVVWDMWNGELGLGWELLGEFVECLEMKKRGEIYFGGSKFSCDGLYVEYGFGMDWREGGK